MAIAPIAAESDYGGPATAEAPQLLALHNRARKKAGVAPLRLNHKLTTVALYYARYLCKKGDISHGADGYNCGQRLRAADYAWAMCGENLALHSCGTPEKVTHAWMGSPGHRANILRPEFTEAGFAHIGWTWVAVFAQPRPELGR